MVPAEQVVVLMELLCYLFQYNDFLGAPQEGKCFWVNIPSTSKKENNARTLIKANLKGLCLKV